MAFNDMTLEDAYKLADNKSNWHKTDSQLYKDVYSLNAQNIRDYYGIEEDVPLYKVEQYITALEDEKNRTDTKKNLLTKITDTTINPNVQKAADAITNFSYDPSKDAAYQAYVDMYNRQGQSAAKQTLNNLNAANMGRNSSYSSAATAQVQQAYAQKASEMIPTLAEQAYERLMNNYSINKDMDDTAYNRALTGYQTLADDYTRSLTDEQLRLSNKGAEFANKASEIDLKFYEPNAQLSYDMGKLEYDDAKFNSDLNRKYAERQILADMYSGGGSGGGGSSGGSYSSGVGLNMKNIDNFIEGFNKSMIGQDYYTAVFGEDSTTPIINGANGQYKWGSNIGGQLAWEKPIIEALQNDPSLSFEEVLYLQDRLGLNTGHNYLKEVDPEGKSYAERYDWEWMTPLERYKLDADGTQPYLKEIIR